MTDLFELLIFYLGVFLFGVGLTWFYRNPLWDRIDPWKNKPKKNQRASDE